MSGARANEPWGVPEAAIREALEQGSQRVFDRRRTVQRVLRRDRCAYSTSFAIEELDVLLDGGERLALVFKNLGADALLDNARASRPAFLYEPDREVAVYQEILAGAGLGTATCYAGVRDGKTGRYWLFLERLDAPQLRHIGEPEAWDACARWLASLHALPLSSSAAETVPLLRYDRPFYDEWFRRLQGLLQSGAGRAADRAALARVADAYQAAVEALVAAPRTFIHSEFYPSNVLVAPAAHGGVRICPIDWETAAIGPAMMDLAALVAGEWPEGVRERMLAAYLGERARLGASAAPPEESARLLDLCRLHHAVQW